MFWCDYHSHCVQTVADDVHSPAVLKWRHPAVKRVAALLPSAAVITSLLVVLLMEGGGGTTGPCCSIISGDKYVSTVRWSLPFVNGTKYIQLSRTKKCVGKVITKQWLLIIISNRFKRVLKGSSTIFWVSG